MPEKSAFHVSIGREGGLKSYATRTPEQEQRRKEAAAAGRMRRFLEQVPAHVTDPIERAQKAAALQKAHMQSIARRSAVRRRRPTT
jgi:hypothetical protein